MAPDGSDKILNLTNVIITIMAGIIAVLIASGFGSINSKVDSVMAKLDLVNKNYETLRDDVTVLKTHQQIRLNREAREEMQRKGIQ